MGIRASRPDARERQWTEVVAGIRPRIPLVLGLGYLVLCWTVLMGIDLHDWSGLRDRFLSRDDAVTVLWLHVFANGGPTEWLQWLTLGAAAAAAGMAAGWSAASHGKAGTVPLFWGLLSLAFVLMLIEDAGELRHALREYAGALSGGSTTVDRVVEFVYFGALASVPLVAFVFFRRGALGARSSRFYLYAGLVGYAVAGGGSSVRHWGGGEDGLGGWYTWLGEAAQSVIGGTMVHHNFSQQELHFLLMDRAFEESVELLAATCFLVGTLAYLRRLGADQLPTPRPPAPEYAPEPEGKRSALQPHARAH